MSNELKPCPFCGTPATTVAAINGTPIPLEAVICRECGAMCPRQTEAEAIAAWNTRPPADPEPAPGLAGRLLEQSSRAADYWRTDDAKTCAEAAARIQSDAAELARLRAENAALLVALHDAIRRPMGVVPASAEQFYDAALGTAGEG